MTTLDATAPALTLLSLGAGVQSTALCLLAADGTLPKLDGAIFADTGWEPAAVYAHLDRIEAEILKPAGIPLYRVSAGNIREDAVNDGHRFASMPLFTKGPCQTCHGWEIAQATCEDCKGTGETLGLARRQCTSEYKIAPIKRQIRDLLGYPHPRPVPRGVFVEQWIGISRDEFSRAKDSGIQYARNRFPLLELDLTRRDCLRILHAAGWETTPKSACIGCPFHGNRVWRALRDNHPEEWADAVDFDAQIRAGASGVMRGQMFLHSSRVPLDQAPIDHHTRAELIDAQLDLTELAKDIEAGVDVDAYDAENGYENGCGPWSCRSDGM